MTDVVGLNYSSIIFLGSFNPAIFQTQWFDRYKILPIQETKWAEGEKPKVIEVPYEGSKFIFEEVPRTYVMPSRTYITFPSLTIDVTLDRYACITTKIEKIQLIKDVTVKIFGILEHTPIRSVGINFEGHWKCKDNAQEKLRNLFARDDGSFKKIFGNEYHIGGTIAFEQDSRIVKLIIKESILLNDGIHFNFNFHHEDTEPHPATAAVDIIKNKFDEDLDNSIKYIKELIGEPEEIWKPTS